MKSVLVLKQEDKPNIRIFRFNILVLRSMMRDTCGNTLFRYTEPFYSEDALNISPDVRVRIGIETTCLIRDIFKIGKEDEKGLDSIIHSVILTPWEIKVELNCAFYEQLEEKILGLIDRFLEIFGWTGKMEIYWGTRIYRNGFHFDIPAPLPSGYSLDALECLVTYPKDTN